MSSHNVIIKLILSFPSIKLHQIIELGQLTLMKLSNYLLKYDFNR